MTRSPGTPAPPPAERGTHLRPSLLLVVAAGGMVGTAAREALVLAVPEVAGLPVAVFGINVLGGFLLGVLLEALVLSGPDIGGRRTLRLLGGTGFCGGFTTYSALATACAALVSGGSPAPAALYGLATVVVGGLASWLGVAAGALRGRRTP